MEQGDIAPTGGLASSGMSVERIAALSGVAPQYVTGVAVKDANGEHFTLNRSEALGGAGEAPYLRAEGGEAATSAISFVVPPGSAHSGSIASGMRGALVLVLTIEGGLLELAPVSFSPEAPHAESSVEFAKPGITGGALPGSPHSYHWVFGDGKTSNEEAPQHTYPASAENGVTDYEASVEVVLSNFEGKVIAAGIKVVPVPVTTTQAAQAPPPPQAAAPTAAPETTAAPTAAPETTAAPTAAPETTTTTTTTTTAPPKPKTTPAPPRRPAPPAPVSQPQVATGPHSRTSGEGGRGPASYPGAGVGNVENGGEGVGGGTTSPAASGRTGGGAEAHGVSSKSTASLPTQKRRGRSKSAPPPVTQPPGLVGVLLNSVTGALPASALAGASAAASTLPFSVTHASGASVSPVGGLGLALGIVAVLFTVLLGVFGELREWRRPGWG